MTAKMDNLIASLANEGIDEKSAREAFINHLVDKANAARLKFGLYIDYETITRMLDDRDIVRYPMQIEFDSRQLQNHEFAFPKAIGFHPSDGYCLFIHEHFRNQPENLPLLIAYHIPTINYGSIVEPQHAEAYGAALIGLEVQAYYQALCELADSTAKPS